MENWEGSLFSTRWHGRIHTGLFPVTPTAIKATLLAPHLGRISNFRSINPHVLEPSQVLLQQKHANENERRIQVGYPRSITLALELVREALGEFWLHTVRPPPHPTPHLASSGWKAIPTCAIGLCCEVMN